MEGGTWERKEPLSVFAVRVEGPSGSDFLQATARDASEAEAAVREVLMPGVAVMEVKLAERRAA